MCGYDGNGSLAMCVNIDRTRDELESNHVNKQHQQE